MNRALKTVRSKVLSLKIHYSIAYQQTTCAAETPYCDLEIDDDSYIYHSYI